MIVWQLHGWTGNVPMTVWALAWLERVLKCGARATVMCIMKINVHSHSWSCCTLSQTDFEFVSAKCISQILRTFISICLLDTTNHLEKTSLLNRTQFFFKSGFKKLLLKGLLLYYYSNISSETHIGIWMLFFVKITSSFLKSSSNFENLFVFSSNSTLTLVNSSLVLFLCRSLVETAIL